MEVADGLRLNFNLNLELHLRSLQKTLKSKKVAEKRKHILSWMHLLMTNLKLSSRTIELCLILADRLLFVNHFKPKNIELFGIACIIFMIKHEGDFSPELCSFIKTVHNTFSDAEDSLLELEKTILVLTPSDFIYTSSLSDYVHSLLSALEGSIRPRPKIQSLIDEALKRLIFSHNGLEIDYLIAFPTLAALLETTDYSQLKRRMAFAFKKLKPTHGLSARRFQEYAGRFLNKPII